MNRPAAKEKTRSSGRSRSYLQTRVRGQRLYEAAFILAIIELSRRLHQAYRQAYGKQAADWLLPQNPSRLSGTQVDTLRGNLQKFLDDPECGKFINAMLGSLPSDVWKTSKSSGSLMDTFNSILSGGGFWSGDTISKNALAITDPNTMTTTFDSQRSTPYITGRSWEQLGATVLLAHELTHVFTNAPNSGAYGHLQMAQAASAAASSLGLNLKSAGFEFPTTQKYGTGDAYDTALSSYFNSALAYACRKVKL